MLSLIGAAYQKYTDFILSDKYVDPRSKNMFLISCPITMFIIITNYLYFCTKCGPRWMASRPPFELKNTLIIYNVLQILVSSYITIEGTLMWFQFDSWICAKQDFSTNPLPMRVLNLSWVYFIAKVSELLDTVFFVLRKKNNQISFLHLFHHTLMVIIVWLGMRYTATGHIILFGILNSYVHVAMYTYYLIAGLGPEYQKYLWWKKHLTTIQLVQFVIIVVQNIASLATSCDYPLTVTMAELIFPSTFIYMFGKFYINNYIKNKTDEKNNNKVK